jgi:polynucleotide 5'-hydroxyl-kinase GRC3/NOL9
VNEHEALVERVASSANTVVLIGGLDSGKSTLARSLLATAIAGGRRTAYLDADVGQKCVGPPGTIGLRMLEGTEDLGPTRLPTADALAFVGSTSPQGHLLPVVTGTATLLARARAAGAELVVIDTSGFVAGIYGQLLKYHKVEMTRPDVVVGLQRGEELGPLLGVIQRFFASEVVALGVHPNVVPSSVEQRAENRELAMRSYFGADLHRWRVKPTVFMPALPPLFDLAQLDRLLVGLSDGDGSYLGIGFLEYGEDEVLRLVSPVADGPKALRLGSVRLEENFRAKRVDLRNLFGTE